MSISIVRLGSPRRPEEGLRLGTVRRPPRGVPRAEFAPQDWYDVWFPNLAPSPDTVKRGLAAKTPVAWAGFVKRYRAEMKKGPAQHDLTLLAAFSKSADFSVGCYCAEESRCHRSVLRQLLLEAGAEVLPG